VERNLYAPPAAVVADVGPWSRRPALLWVCLAFYAVIVVFSMLMLASYIGGAHIPTLPRFRAGYVFWDKPWFVVNVLSIASATIAAVLLFRCRKSAAYLATAVFLCRALGYLDLNPGGRSPQHQSLISSLGVVIILSLAVCVWWLRRTEVLR
jgi:hypothetical protein